MTDLWDPDKGNGVNLISCYKKGKWLHSTRLQNWVETTFQNKQNKTKNLTLSVVNDEINFSKINPVLLFWNNMHFFRFLYL